MVEENNVITMFLYSTEYTKIAEKIIFLSKKRLCTDIYEAEILYCQKVLRIAMLSLADIRLLFKNDSRKLEEFCLRLIKMEQKINSMQEFNPIELEEQEEVNETYVGHSKTFLLTSSVMFFLLKNRKSEFLKYLRAIRQPQANKYRHGVELIFDSLVLNP